jgi:hypothetical protein
MNTLINMGLKMYEKGNSFKREGFPVWGEAAYQKRSFRAGARIGCMRFSGEEGKKE